MRLPPVSDHGSEIGLLSIIAVGVIALLVVVAVRGVEGWDIAACLLVLQGIISAIKERWTQRSVDRMGEQLGSSTPNGTDPGNPQPVIVTNTSEDPVQTEQAR